MAGRMVSMMNRKMAWASAILLLVGIHQACSVSLVSLHPARQLRLRGGSAPPPGGMGNPGGPGPPPGGARPPPPGQQKLVSRGVVTSTTPGAAPPTGLSTANPSSIPSFGGPGSSTPPAVPAVSKAAQQEKIGKARNQLQQVLDANSKLEEQVSQLASSYEKLAKSYGLGSFKPTRTASYSCLDDALLTEKVREPEPEEQPAAAAAAVEAPKPPPGTPPVERANKKIEEKLAKDIKPLPEVVKEEPLKPEERLNIVIISSEIAPFSKSGGLADVCDKLGVALSRLGHRVMTIAPLYWRYEGCQNTGVWKEFGLFNQKHRCEFWRKWHPTVDAKDGEEEQGVEHVFVQNGCFERHGMYGHNDDLMRFTLLAWAALEAPFSVPCKDGQPIGDDVVFLVNDWMVGLVPLILTSHYRRYNCYDKARCIFDIHNMGYCGNFGVADPHDLGLPDGAYYDKLFHDRQIKLLKGGIELADRVVTVSETYRDEIMTPEGGWGLQEACKGRFPHLDGVLNGIDMFDWNPATDPFLSAKFQGYDNFYSVTDMQGKTACKQHLQSHLGLQEDPKVPMIAFIGRLAYQKGIDVLESVFEWLMNGDHQGVTGYVQLVMMGTGDEKYGRFLRDAEGRHKGKVSGIVGFSSELEHKILAAADILVMPSRYEPCGLPQMYAQRYGTVPCVHSTGGLKDSVVQFDPFANTGTGWKFDTADEEGLKWSLWNALNTYKNHKEAWDGIVQRCMETDFSWERSAKRYVEIFRWAKIDPPYHQPHPF